MRIPGILFVIMNAHTNRSRSDLIPHGWVFDKINAGCTMYIYTADLIEALHKHVDLLYSMDLFVSKVVIS